MVADPDRVYTLADLDDLNVAPVPLAVFGHPIKHSISPAMHNAALADMAAHDERFGDWCYYRFDIEPERLGDALKAFAERKFAGINLTIPHKVDAVDMVTAIETDAATMGAVNTLRLTPEGYHGHNTDGFGLERAIAENLDVSLADQSIVLLGAGGAARAAAVQCLRKGCKHLFIGNRSTDRLAGLIALLENALPHASVTGFPFSEVPEAALEADLIINATSAGLKPDDEPPVDLAQFRGKPKLFDMIYNPAEPCLVREARKLGWSAANGLEMLVWQGVRALEIWSETDVPAATMKRAAEGALTAH